MSYAFLCPILFFALLDMTCGWRPEPTPDPCLDNLDPCLNNLHYRDLYYFQNFLDAIWKKPVEAVDRDGLAALHPTLHQGVPTVDEGVPAADDTVGLAVLSQTMQQAVPNLLRLKEDIKLNRRAPAKGDYCGAMCLHCRSALGLRYGPLCYAQCTEGGEDADILSRCKAAFIFKQSQ